MSVTSDLLSGRATVEAEALANLDDAVRDDYEAIVVGLAGLEVKLPASCTQENKDAIGDVIVRARKVEVYCNDLFKTLCAPWRARIDRQRELWKPLGDRAAALALKARGLVEALLEEEKKRREAEERAARQRVSEAQAAQAAAEAKALAAETPEAQQAATKDADAAWQLTKQAVGALDKQPAQTKVRVGSATVFERRTLDYEVVDVAAFAKAHPDLVEIKRGPTLAGLRDATAGLAQIPETLPGWPGLRLKLTPKTASR